jgi:Plant transposon protein
VAYGYATIRQIRHTPYAKPHTPQLFGVWNTPNAIRHKLWRTEIRQTPYATTLWRMKYAKRQTPQMWRMQNPDGHAGTNNDINILHASDFYASFLDGQMKELEENVVPFYIGNKKFNKMYVLVDGVVPQVWQVHVAFSLSCLPGQEKVWWLASCC